MDPFYDDFSVDDILNEIRQNKINDQTPTTGVDRLVAQIAKEQASQEKTPVPSPADESHPPLQAERPVKRAVVASKEATVPSVKETPTPQAAESEKAKEDTPRRIKTTTPTESVPQPTILSVTEQLPPMMRRQQRRYFVESEQTPMPTETLKPEQSRAEQPNLIEQTYHADDRGGIVPDSNSYIQLRENRKKKIKDFVLFGDEESVPDEEAQIDREYDEDRVVEEFASMEDAPTVWDDLKELNTSITVRLVLLLVMTVVNLYVVAANTFTILPLPSALRISESPMFYALGSLLLLVIATIIAHTTVFSGLINFFKMKADGDSLSAITLMVALIQSIVYLLFPESLAIPGVHLYSSIALLGLAFNSIGKLLIVKRTIVNFRYVIADCDKYSTQIIDDEHMASDLTKGVLTNLPVTVVNQKTGFLTKFLDMSFCEDIYDGISRWACPIIFGAALILGVGGFAITKNIYMALTAFCGVFVVCSSLYGLFSVNLPLYDAVKSVHKHGGMIIGYPAAEEFVDINTATAQGSDLFPAGTVMLHGIKTFRGGRIDDAILDAASILVKAESILSDIFMQVIQGKPELLKEVDTIVYEDAMGISGWVDNKRVLIGSRELMLNHGVDVPSKDYEKRYCGENNSIVYLSNSGELTAVFILSLHAAESVTVALEKMVKNDVFLIVKTVDAILTKEKLAEVFQVEPALFRVIPARLHKPYNQLHAYRDRAEGYVANNGNFYSYVSTMLTAKRLKSKIMLGVVATLASVIIGFLAVTVFCLMGNMTQLNPLFLTIYHLIWFGVAWVFQWMRRL